jgi:hypothetical protein
VSVFAKAAVDTKTAAWLRAEYLAYSTLELACMPKLLGWHEGSDVDGDWPVMMIEWMQGGRWVPPWEQRDLWAVKDAFDELEATTLPEWIGAAEVQWAGGPWAELFDGDDLSILGLDGQEVVSALAERLCALDSSVLAGDILVHGDVRSDNIYIARNGTARLFDWNWTTSGGRGVDEALWTVSLLGEGIEPISELDAGSWDVVAYYTGVLARRASKPGSDRLRSMQRRQVVTCVDWLGRNA